MGWWFRSGPQSSSDKAPEAPVNSQSTSPNPSSSSHDPNPKLQQVPKSAPLTQDQRTEAEISQLLASLEPSRAGSGNGASQNSASGTPPPKTELDNSIPLPDQMKCHTLFDAAYHCSSFGGQLNNVYRYGSMRECSEHWSAFWFCMRTRGYSTESRREAIRQFYRDQESRVKKGPCSDDIWDERSPAERTTMNEQRFQRDPDVDFGLRKEEQPPT